MQRLDAQILAEVRSLLERRWIDVSALRLGTTNGVVYVEGVLRPQIECFEEGPGTRRLRERLRREIEAMEGVREVVLTAFIAVEGKEAWRSAPKG